MSTASVYRYGQVLSPIPTKNTQTKMNMKKNVKNADCQRSRLPDVSTLGVRPAGLLLLEDRVDASDVDLRARREFVHHVALGGNGDVAGHLTRRGL